MASNIVDSLREGRRVPAVLKVKLAHIRTRKRGVPVFVFEGVDDVGPYQVWIERCKGGCSYEPLTADGKKQVLDFRALLQHDAQGLAKNVFFFVDRDFDDLQEHESGPDIFITEDYSIENTLVSDRVLEGLLNDELRCSGEVIDKERVLSKFREVLAQFLNLMSEANRLLYVANVFGIRLVNKEERVSKYVNISLTSVAAAHSLDDLNRLIVLERAPTAIEMQRASVEFDKLEPHSRHRGKFVLDFFRRWVALVADARKVGDPSLFSRAVRHSFSGEQLRMRTLADRSDIPIGLEKFVSEICQRAAGLPVGTEQPTVQ